MHINFRAVFGQKNRSNLNTHSKPFLVALYLLSQKGTNTVFSWLRLHPLCHKLSNSQPRLSQRLRVGAPVAVHVVAVGGAVDEDGRGIGGDVLQDSHGVPRVDCPVDKYYIVNVRVVTSVSEAFK